MDGQSFSEGISVRVQEKEIISLIRSQSEGGKPRQKYSLKYNRLGSWIVGEISIFFFDDFPELNWKSTLH